MEMAEIQETHLAEIFYTEIVEHTSDIFNGEKFTRKHSAYQCPSCKQVLHESESGNWAATCDCGISWNKIANCMFVKKPLDSSAHM